MIAVFGSPLPSEDCQALTLTSQPYFSRLLQTYGSSFDMRSRLRALEELPRDLALDTAATQVPNRTKA